MLKRLRSIAVLASGLLIPIAATGLAQAATPAVVQSYATTVPLQPGLIVQLTGHKSAQVTAATAAHPDKMFGVVINPTASPVSLSQTGSGQQVYVAASGSYEVLVDNQDGPIAIGDYVTISSISGIGREATTDDQTVLGKATSAFSGVGDSIGNTSLRAADGQNTTVQLGLITVAINVAHNPGAHAPASATVPSFLQQAGRRIADKPVSSTRLYLGLGILLVAVILVGGMLFAGVRGSIVAIGRNPLSKRSINSSLIQVILASLIIVIIAVFGVYLVLTI